MYNLGNLYYDIHDFDNMFKYFYMAIEQKDIDTMYELAIYYQKKNDFDNMQKYYIMALTIKNHDDCNQNMVNNGIKYFDLFILKKILDNNEIKTPDILERIYKINSNPEIMIFENKKKLFTRLNNIIECGICYETNVNIDLYCGHLCCIDCYPKLYKNCCPFCRL
jgi:tetratricopeptide (TPR) repeat protein